MSSPLQYLRESRIPQGLVPSSQPLVSETSTVIPSQPRPPPQFQYATTPTLTLGP